jgi:hypothetical protein
MMLESLLDVVVPAGGTISPAYAVCIGTPFRALAPLGPDRQMVMQRVVNTLRESGCVRRIIGVGPAAVQETIQDVDAWLSSGASGPMNIRAGLQTLFDPDTPALVCTSDLPLLTAESVRGFVTRCRADADVSIGLVGKAAYLAAFPQSPMSLFVPFRDVGPVTMSCLFCVRPRLLERHSTLLDQAFVARKSQWKMAALLGPRLTAQFALRRLRLSAVQARSERLLHCQADVVWDCAPALALDMDTADDYAYANACLSEASA